MKLSNVAKLFVLSLAILSDVSFASVCDDPINKGDLCFNMRYLRSQVMVLGAQRELMQVNYPLLKTIGEEIKATGQHINESQLLGTDHSEGIRAVMDQAQNLVRDASIDDPLALQTANSIQKRCASCHNEAHVTGDLSWDRIFKNDWDHIAKNCSLEGHNPYLCRSMHGMLSSYMSIFSAAQMERQSFEALVSNASEIGRIAKDLDLKKMVHQSSDIFSEVIVKSDNVIRLAKAQNKEAFEQGMMITQSCMKCHGEATGKDDNIEIKQKWSHWN